MKSILSLFISISAIALVHAQENPHTIFVKAVEKCWTNELNSALEYLQSAFERGYEHPSDVLSQKAFRPLRLSPEYRRKASRLLRKYVVEKDITIVDESEPGDQLIIYGKIVREDGSPVPDAVFYLYQTDSKGLYAPEELRAGSGSNNPRLFGYCRTDSSGLFTVHTVRPGSYPNTGNLRHVHFEITAPQCTTVSEFFLDEDPEPTEKQIKDAEERNFPILTAEKIDKRTYSVHLLWTCK